MNSTVTQQAKYRRLWQKMYGLLLILKVRYNPSSVERPIKF